MSTVLCPHCQAGYAFEAILIEESLRCARCEKLFLVSADGGVAEMEEDPASSAKTATGIHVRRGPVKTVDSAPAAAAAVKPLASAPAPAAPPAVNKHKLTAQQEEARREMSKALAGVMTRAGEAVKAAPAGSDHALIAKKGKRSGGILVVGEGRSSHKSMVAWSIGATAIVALVVVVLLISGRRSPTQKALDEYVAYINGTEAHTPLRLKRMQERAWISGSCGLLSLGNVGFSPPKRLKTAAAKPALAFLSGQQFLPGCEVWVPAEQADAATARWIGTRTLAENVTALAGAGIVATTRPDIAKCLEEASVDQESAELLLSLLPHDGHCGQHAAQRIAQGQVPEEVEVIAFTGRKGVGLLPNDRGHSYPEVPTYDGRLLRFLDKDWPDGWRVLELRYVVANSFLK